METWMWRDEREKLRVWDDRGPSYCITPQGLGCGSIVDISVEEPVPQIARGVKQMLRNRLAVG